MPQIPAGWYHDPAPQPREVRRCCGIGMAGCGLNTWRRYTPGYSLGGSRSALGTPAAMAPAAPVVPASGPAVAPAPVPTPYPVEPGQSDSGQSGRAQPAFAPRESTPPPTTADGEALAGWWYRVAAFVVDSVLISIVSSMATIPAQIALTRDLTPVLDDFERRVDANPDEFPPLGQLFRDILDVGERNLFWLIVPSLVILVAYHVIFLRWKGATPGKLAVGLRVRSVAPAGREPSGLESGGYELAGYESTNRNQTTDPSRPGWDGIVIRVTTQFLVAYVALALGFLTGSWVVLSLLLALATLYGLLDPLWATWDDKRQTLHDKMARTQVVKVDSSATASPEKDANTNT